MRLNQAQKNAICHKDGPMLVLAGPGSGKTLVITERTKYLIQEYNIPEENILVITFTRAAAGEMKERFLRLLGVSRTDVGFGTFHSIFFTILRHAYSLSPENIIREDERRACLKDIVSGMGHEYEDENEYISELLSEISMVKGNRIELSTYYSLSCADEVFRNIYREYNRRIRKHNKIDFDDMLLLCYELLSERQDILKLWQSKFRYILIDEFQDINILQYEIVRMLAAPENNLFIVGDDDQSIYRFRGAKPEIMLNFPTDYPDSKRVLLNINYRSNTHIIKAAGNLISHNKNRFDKELAANIKDGGEVIVERFETMSEQNIRLAEEILKLAEDKKSLSGMCILVRTNLGAGAVIQKMIEYNIPFIAGDNLPNIYDHWITQDIISYIKIAMGETSRSLYLRIINRPARYIGRECFVNPNVNIRDIEEYYEDKEWMKKRIEQFEYDLAMLSKMKPFAAIQYIRRGIGYEDFLRDYAVRRKMKPEELIDILDELQESARGFDTYTDWFLYMEEYKEELKKQESIINRKKTDGVHIMTMHSSKGLEFSTVFIVDANEGIMPHKKSVLPESIEEERRLFYVAMTRAKKKLYIFSSGQRYNKAMLPSRFIAELCYTDFF
ncbi:MAG TPA: ATP-dependent helicase [Clostridiales bacterium]|jgi:DNA helicase-2/ATP-dependent DNA helicase PcrA|nr:ATP-dependent helicase [Clostridiales bacterium]